MHRINYDSCIRYTTLTALTYTRRSASCVQLNKLSCHTLSSLLYSIHYRRHTVFFACCLCTRCSRCSTAYCWRSCGDFRAETKVCHMCRLRLYQGWQITTEQVQNDHVQSQESFLCRVLLECNDLSPVWSTGTAGLPWVFKPRSAFSYFPQYIFVNTG